MFNEAILIIPADTCHKTDRKYLTGKGLSLKMCYKGAKRRNLYIHRVVIFRFRKYRFLDSERRNFHTLFYRDLFCKNYKKGYFISVPIPDFFVWYLGVLIIVYFSFKFLMYCNKLLWPNSNNKTGVVLCMLQPKNPIIFGWNPTLFKTSISLFSWSTSSMLNVVAILTAFSQSWNFWVAMHLWIW